MNAKRVLKITPFGLKDSKELFEKIVKLKFLKLLESDQITDYYDFIFSAGALRDWLKHELNLQKDQLDELFYNDKNYSAFNSIYNNSKHFILTTERKDLRYYITLDGRTIQTNDFGDCVLTDDTILTDDTYLLPKVFGESGKLTHFCAIMDEETGNSECIFLYEICKLSYLKFEKLVNEYYT